MTAPGGNDPHGSTRTGRTETTASGTTTGADTSARMTGTHEVTRPTGHHAVTEHKTSVAAAFALVFGLSALFCALTAILSPFAVLFGLIGIILGIAGLKMAKRPGVTGKGVAIGGLVTAILGFLIGAAVLAGIGVLVNDEQRLNQLENQIQDLRQDLPSTSELREELPN